MASSSAPDGLPPPPQYSQTTTTTTPTGPLQPPPYPSIPFHKYRIPHSKLSEDSTTVTIKDPRYASDPIALASLFRAQANLPPRLLLHMSGTSGNDWQITTDFDIWIDMTSMIYRSTDRWHFSTTKDPPGGIPRPSEKSPQPGSSSSINSPLNIWTNKFCKDKASIKRIALNREITNLDTEYIAGALRNLVTSSAIQYKGKIEVKFVLQHARIVYQVGEVTTMSRVKNFFGLSPKPENADEEGVLCYDVLTSFWPYATIPPEAHGAREFAVASEAAWWQMWKGPIQNAVIDGRRGWLSMEDWVSVAMGREVAVRTKPWADANFQ